jgi:hypothetical protein
VRRRRHEARCLRCGDVIESRHAGDFVRCSCGSVSLSGGPLGRVVSGDPDALGSPDEHDGPLRTRSTDSRDLTPVHRELLMTADTMSRMLTGFTSRVHADGLDPEPPWRSEVRNGRLVLRSDLELVDRMADRGVATLHVCAHPHHNDPYPIFGFDVVAGRESAAAVFLDLSPTTPGQRRVVSRFSHAAKRLGRNSRGADLPGWAQEIFSPGILAVRGLDQGSLRAACELAVSTLGEWVSGLTGRDGEPDNTIVEAHRRYALRQRENTRTARSLVALGNDPDYVDRFITTRLFPEPEAMAAG